MNGQTTQLVHIPVGVGYSTKHEPALTPRKYYFVLLFSGRGSCQVQLFSCLSREISQEAL